MAGKKGSTALAVSTSSDLLPAEVDYDELMENLEEMDDIEFPRIRFRQGKFFSDDPDDSGAPCSRSRKPRPDRTLLPLHHSVGRKLDLL